MKKEVYLSATAFIIATARTRFFCRREQRFGQQEFFDQITNRQRQNDINTNFLHHYFKI